MSKSFTRIFAIAFCIMLLAGCSLMKNKTEPSGVSELLKYKDSFVGDNSAVGNILYNLDGGQFVKQYALQTKNQPYGIEITYGKSDDATQAEFEAFGSDESFKRTFISNTTAIFALIQNVDYIKIKIETGNNTPLTITRAELENYYGEDIRKFSQNEHIWVNKITESKVNTKDIIESFFEEHVKTN